MESVKDGSDYSWKHVWLNRQTVSSEQSEVCGREFASEEEVTVVKAEDKSSRQGETVWLVAEVIVMWSKREG